MDGANFFLVGDNEDGQHDNEHRQINNGRVKLCDDRGCSRATPYGLFTPDGKTSSTDGDMLDSLRRLDIASSVVANAFFARGNVDGVQASLRHEVYRASEQQRLVVGRQSDIELGIIMRSVYLSDTTQSRSVTLREHVSELNRRVLDFSVPVVLSEARMYLTYLQSIQTMPVPLKWGEIASQKGSRQLVQRGELL